MKKVSVCNGASSGSNSFSHLAPGQLSNLRAFTFSELRKATKDFSRSLILSDYGLGSVYRGAIQSTQDPHYKVDVAVRRLRGNLQGQKQFLTEVSILGVAEHQNLVKLVGYCVDVELLLIYEYMPNRSVQSHLFSQSDATLPWKTRLKIAQDVARGLAYLHDRMKFQVTWRRFKPSDLLLDEQWNVKLSDFGIAWLGPTELCDQIAGVYRYIDPEYTQSGDLTSKSDVWSYGVFLCELISGVRHVDWSPAESEEKCTLTLDPRLEDKYSLNSVLQLATVANWCLTLPAQSRPKMSQVLEMVNRIVEKHKLQPFNTPEEHLAFQTYF